MTVCTIRNLTKYYGGNLVFENISFDLKLGDRLALLGRNGIGKSTLLRILAGLEGKDGGDIALRQGVRINYLDQIPSFDPSFTAKDVLLLAFRPLIKQADALHALEEELVHDSDNTQLLERYGRAQSEFELAGGYRMEERLARISTGLDIDAELQNRLFTQLSGGEKSRIMMGKILLEEPDILLLDEPSNHLDWGYLEWLESYLKSYEGSVILASHDRVFLQSTVTAVVELTKNRAEYYPGDYSYYLKERESRLEQRYKEWEIADKEYSRLEEMVRRYRIWGGARDSEAMYKRAKEIEKRLEKMVVPEKPIMHERSIRIKQNIKNRSGREVLRVRDLIFGYDEELLRLKELDVFYQERVAIVGANGVGKTTLLRLLMGELEPWEGQVRRGSRVTVGYMPQNIEFENPNDTLIEAFQRYHPLLAPDVRSYLARVLFTGEDVFKTVDMLSGGEKSRLMLACIAYGERNLLFMDEPTNHLDIDSREELEKNLEDYPGTLVFVSHDRYFIQRMATKIIEIVDGECHVHQGGYDYWQDKRLLKQGIATASSENVKAVTGGGKEDFLQQKERERRERRWRRELEQCELEMAECEERLHIIGERLMKEQELDVLQELYAEKIEKEAQLLDLLKQHDELLAQSPLSE